MAIGNSLDASIDYSRYLLDFNVGRTRERRNVMFRNAYAVALTDYFGPSKVGHITGRDHATIIYARNMHDVNIKYDEAYIKAYAHCKSRLATLMTEHGWTDTPYSNYSRMDLYELISRKDQEIVELKYQLYRAKEYRQQQEALQGVL